MYTVGVSAAFRAQHQLVGADFGAESQMHHHDYRLHVELEGEQLVTHDFLVDINDVRAAIASQVRRFEGRVLNEDSEFAGRNPSVELLAQQFCLGVVAQIDTRPIGALTVTVWETEDAWAAYRHEL